MHRVQKTLMKRPLWLVWVVLVLVAGTAAAQAGEQAPPAVFGEGVLYDITVEVSQSQSILLQELYIVGKASLDDRTFLVVRSQFPRTGGSTDKRPDGYVELSKVRAIVPTGQRSIRVV